MDLDHVEIQGVTPEFLDYLFKQAKRYSAKDLKRFADHKRYADDLLSTGDPQGVAGSSGSDARPVPHGPMPANPKCA